MNKRKLWLVLAGLITLVPGVAWALSQASIPTRIGIPWANGAAPAYIRSIPTTSQIGIQNCAASFPDGFPPLTFTPPAGGGCPPFGQDFNGVLKQITQWNQWQAAGGPVSFDATFAAAIGGYPNGAKLASAVTPGLVWMSTADNNSTNPDLQTATNWVQDPGQVPIGTPVQALSTSIPSGYVSANGLTIGNGSSNATGRQNADTQFLFNFVWNNCPNAICPIFTSGGSPSSRGASSWADFAANKQLAVHNMNGSGLMGADSQNGTSSSQLVNVPVTSGSRTAPASILGENLHQLVSTELPNTSFSGTTGTMNSNTSHTHTYTASVGTVGVGSQAIAINAGTPAAGGNVTSSTNIDHTHNFSGTINGGNGSHNTVARSTIVYWNLKL